MAIYTHEYYLMSGTILDPVSFNSTRKSLQKPKIPKLKKLPKTYGNPNLVFIVNESLGNFLSRNDDGLPINSEYYRNRFLNDSDTFVFQNARAISGNTETAATSMLLGRYLASTGDSKETKDFLMAPNLATYAKSQGYKTALFISYESKFTVESR
ncbi:hypothetical protein HDV02_001069, partial [Globomyces sp. JEL0801]